MPKSVHPPEWANTGALRWSQDYFYALRDKRRQQRNERRPHRASVVVNTPEALSEKSVKEIAEWIMGDVDKLRDVFHWWLPQLLRSSDTDALDLFLKSSIIQEKTVNDFVFYQWHLVHLPVLEDSSYAETTPRIKRAITRLSRSLSKKLHAKPMRKNPPPVVSNQAALSQIECEDRLMACLSATSTLSSLPDEDPAELAPEYPGPTHLDLPAHPSPISSPSTLSNLPGGHENHEPDTVPPPLTSNASNASTRMYPRPWSPTSSLSSLSEHPGDGGIPDVALASLISPHTPSSPSSHPFRSEGSDTTTRAINPPSETLDILPTPGITPLISPLPAPVYSSSHHLHSDIQSPSEDVSQPVNTTPNTTSGVGLDVKPKQGRKRQKDTEQLRSEPRPQLKLPKIRLILPARSSPTATRPSAIDKPECKTSQQTPPTVRRRPRRKKKASSAKSNSQTHASNASPPASTGNLFSQEARKLPSAEDLHSDYTISRRGGSLTQRGFQRSSHRNDPLRLLADVAAGRSKGDSPPEHGILEVDDSTALLPNPFPFDGAPREISEPSVIERLQKVSYSRTQVPSPPPSPSMEHGHLQDGHRLAQENSLGLELGPPVPIVPRPYFTTVPWTPTQAPNHLTSFMTTQARPAEYLKHDGLLTPVQTGRSIQKKSKTPFPKSLGEDLRPSSDFLPPIWASGRTELCETLDYFKLHQGGVYTKYGSVRGYLLDGFPGPRDYCSPNGRVIISHGGGCSGIEDRDGTTVIGMNADHNLSRGAPAALQRAFQNKQAIVLLSGSKYTAFPVRFPEECRYFVLGWYVITHAWCYPEEGVIKGKTESSFSRVGQATRSMFRFQWLPEQLPWWDHLLPSSLQSPITNPSTRRLIAPDVTVYECPACTTTSPMVFSKGRCLKSWCWAFYKGYFIGLEYLADLKRELPISEAEYDRREVELVPHAAIHALLSPEAALDTSRDAWNGYHCSNCGKITARIYWSKWHCSKCQVSHEALHRPVKPPLSTVQDHFAKAPLYFHGRPVQHFDSANLRCTLYILAPYSYVYHIGGALHQRVDAVFAAYQQDEVRDLFQRRTLKQSIVRGQRNRHFSFNSGVPYKYCSENDTLPIETGPRCVQLARELVTATTEAVLHYDPGFNEVLSVMYMEDMAMNWHTDNEVGLGDVVASLSLGAACRMRFRGRKSLRKDTPAIGDLPKLTLDLTHGDIVIMQGYVQEYYEHCIENLGGFRIAATCRYIDARIHH